MTYTIVIILITFLIVCGIAATAIQQYNEKKANEKREEVSRQKTVYEETEESIVAALQMPVSKFLIVLMKKRSLNALRIIAEYNPSSDISTKIEEIKKSIKGIDENEPAPDQNQFTLPKSDKVIIKYIQAVKKLRIILRSEQAKGNINPKQFAQEEKELANLQLRVNVETLNKRAVDAIANKMQGSARQYFEKAINALGAHKPQNEYTKSRKAELADMLSSLENNVKDNNLKQLLADKEKESQEIESLFGPKKKW